MTKLDDLIDKGVKIGELISAIDNITTCMEKLKKMGNDMIASSVMGFGLSLLSITESMGKSIGTAVGIVTDYISEESNERGDDK